MEKFLLIFSFRSLRMTTDRIICAIFTKYRRVEQFKENKRKVDVSNKKERNHTSLQIIISFFRLFSNWVSKWKINIIYWNKKINKHILFFNSCDINFFVQGKHIVITIQAHIFIQFIFLFQEKMTIPVHKLCS